MEGGTGIGTWIAYGAMVLFLLLLLAVVLRAVMLYSLLLLSPARRLVDSLRGRKLVDDGHDRPQDQEVAG